MNKLDWITRSLVAEGVTIPPEFSTLLQHGRQRRPPYYFLDAAEGAEDTAWTNNAYPTRRVLRIASRHDDDNAVCIVLNDPERHLGQVLVIHFTSPPGREVETEYDSLSIWARLASEEIEESVRTGSDESIADLLIEDDRSGSGHAG